MWTLFTNPYVILGVLLAWCGSVALAFGYAWHLRSGEVEAQKQLVAQWRQKYTELVESSNTQFNALKDQTTKTIEESSKAIQELDGKLKEKDDDLQKAIRDNLGLRRTLIDRTVVRLFNSSTEVGHSSPEKGKPDQAPSTGVSAEAGSTPSTTTLADLLSVTVTNNKNHLACIKQVEELQKAYNSVYEAFQPKGD